MRELLDELHDEVKRLCAEGDDLANRQRYEEALRRYGEAWSLLPEPKTDWEAAVWLLAAIGDAHFHRGDFLSGRDALTKAMIHGEGAIGNPFLRLRLGQCLYELSDMKEAANWLAGAYLMEGQAIFAEDSPKYLEFVKSKLEPPPGGWPEGW
jgi:hypothetical protein